MSDVKRADHASESRRVPAAVRAEIDKLLATAVDLHKQGHAREAATLYQTILGVDPEHADALHMLGALAHSAGDYERAVELLGRAAGIKPQAAAFHFNLGVSLQALQRDAEAAAAYRRSIELAPAQAAAYENLGVALQDLAELDAAATAYRQALEIDPGAPIAHQNLGTLLANMGDMRAARVHFEHVLARHPAYGDAHTKRAWTLLAEARLEEGWQEYEWRWLGDSFVANNPIRNVPFPRWDGASLADKTILINPEQGLGDELMFATCYSDVIRAAKHCVIECDSRLALAFARSFPAATVLPRERYPHFRWTADLPPIDCRIPAGSLPSFYRNSLENFPAETAYLRPDPTRVAKWREHFASLGKPLTVGVSWRGGREARSSAARSVPLAEWHEILSFSGAAFVNLQYGDHAAEIEAAEREHGIRLHALPGFDAFTDLEGLIAATAALDLVISIDNSTVFVAGAVGTPAWVLLPSSGEWRWLQGRSTSPWFGALTLFRQAAPGLGAWRELIGIVARQLEAAAPRAPLAFTADGAARGPFARSVPARGRGKALFLNDSSSWYHFGCTCTSLAIHAQLRERYDVVETLPIQKLTQLAELPTSVDAFDDDAHFARFSARYSDIVSALGAADVVYVNGEGALHNVAQQARGLLYLVHIAKTRLGRAVHLINHSCYPDDRATLDDNAAFALYKKVYARLDFVAVRESVSTELVRQMGIDATASFDCLPLFVEQYFRPPVQRSRRHVLVAGSVSWGGRSVIGALADYIGRMHAEGYAPRVLIGADAYLAADDFAFVDALSAACGTRFELVRATSALEWLGLIADAALLVSGRFHHTLAAAFVDTPFIAMESNTPKIAGILQMLESPAFLSVHEPELAPVLHERSRRYIDRPSDVAVREEIKAQLRALARRNFDGRGSG